MRKGRSQKGRDLPLRKSRTGLKIEGKEIVHRNQDRKFSFYQFQINKRKKKGKQRRTSKCI